MVKDIFSVLFKRVLEKVIREWKLELEEKGIKEIRLGYKKLNLKLNSLVFADGLAILFQKHGYSNSTNQFFFF